MKRATISTVDALATAEAKAAEAKAAEQAAWEDMRRRERFLEAVKYTSSSMNSKLVSALAGGAARAVARAAIRAVASAVDTARAATKIDAAGDTVEAAVFAARNALDYVPEVGEFERASRELDAAVARGDGLAAVNRLCDAQEELLATIRGVLPNTPIEVVAGRASRRRLHRHLLRAGVGVSRDVVRTTWAEAALRLSRWTTPAREWIALAVRLLF